MEPGYKRHIENNFLELLKITKCNVICTSVLRTHGVLEQADIEELNSIPTDMKRAEKLYDIVMTREGSFPHLIEAFEAGTQTGVLAILNRFVKNDDGSPSNEQPGSAPKRRRKVAPIRFDDQRSEKTISVHRLVQEVTRIELKQSGEEDQTMKTGLQMLSSGIIGNFEENSIPHAISLLKYASILNPEIIAEFKHLPWKIVDVLNIGKRFDESENVGNEMLQLLAKFIPLDDPDLCRLKYQSAVTALTRGQDYEEMLKRNLEILQMLQIKYVENKSAYSTSETLALQSLLVDYLHEFNQYKEALALARKTFAQQKELNGLNHWQTIDALVSVGNSFHQMIFSESRPNPPGAEAMEQLEQIISLLKEAHESNLELIGKDINWTNSINNLMLYLANIGECEFAAKIISDVIERTNNCDCNGDKRYARIVIKCLNILACIKTDEGKLEEALKIYENVHSKYVSLKGQNDGETLSAKLNVILKLMELNKLEDALESCKNVLQSLEKYYPNNLQVIEVQTSMVLILAHMGRLKESRELLNDCEEQSANKFGHDHPIVKGLKSHPFKSRLDSCIKKQDELENSEKVD
ncbi:unnamed protein product [Orchesella dallaii]|uniref:Kinesin light chain n=1 Tax=Orchesella dallaii TaxID=48710 RepID=A0ABP1RHR9_9HEXA